jgi:hypothetical protein
MRPATALPLGIGWIVSAEASSSATFFAETRTRSATATVARSSFTKVFWLSSSGRSCDTLPLAGFREANTPLGLGSLCPISCERLRVYWCLCRLGREEREAELRSEDAADVGPLLLSPMSLAIGEKDAVLGGKNIVAIGGSEEDKEPSP